MAWLVDAVAWVWWCNDLGSRCSNVGLVFYRGLQCVFFFLLTVDYELLVVVVVLGVCNAMVMVIVVLEQKERERKNK